jgi:DNA-directed RNA polymerase II subunit RPB2
MDDLFDNVQHVSESHFQYYESEEEEISQEDAWIVIDKFFTARGLVRQQIDSFDNFIGTTMVEIVQDEGEIKLTPEDQFIPGKEVDKVCNIINFIPKEI